MAAESKAIAQKRFQKPRQRRRLISKASFDGSNAQSVRKTTRADCLRASGM